MPEASQSTKTDGLRRRDMAIAAIGLVACAIGGVIAFRMVGPATTGPADRDLAVMTAAWDQVLARWHRSANMPGFVTVTHIDRWASTDRLADPPADLIKHIRDHGTGDIAPASEVRTRDGSIRAGEAETPARLYWLVVTRVGPDESRVEAGYFAGPRDSLSTEFGVGRSGSRWRVTEPPTRFTMSDPDWTAPPRQP